MNMEQIREALRRMRPDIEALCTNWEPLPVTVSWGSGCAAAGRLRAELAALSQLSAPAVAEEREAAINAFRMDELDAVMVSVDKWFDDGDPRLKNNPATRAADAREIALRAIEAQHPAGEERQPMPFDAASADEMARQIAGLIERHVIDSRSPAADALLGYRGGLFYGPTDEHPAAPAPEANEAKGCETCNPTANCYGCEGHAKWEPKPEPAQAAPSEEEAIDAIWDIVHMAGGPFSETSARQQIAETLRAQIEGKEKEAARMRAALERIRYNGNQAYCSDKCLCAAREMRNEARAALGGEEKS